MKLTKLASFFVYPSCISIKHLINGIPINITNIHKPKFIEIFNLCPNVIFRSQTFKFASEHPVLGPYEKYDGPKTLTPLKLLQTYFN